MKFYCYSLEYVANGIFNNPTKPEVRNIFRDGPFTYIKLESGPKSLTLLGLLGTKGAAASVKRHFHAQYREVADAQGRRDQG